MKNPFVKYYRSFLKFLFFLGLVILPLVYWPSAPVPYEIPRVIFVQRWIEILGVTGVIFYFFSKTNQRQDIKLILLVLGFLFVALLSSYFGVDFKKSLLGNYFRFDGLLTLFHLVGFFFFLSLFWEENWKYLTAVSIGFGSFLVSFWSVVAGVRLYVLGDLSVPHWEKAVIVSFGQPQFAGGFLLVGLPFLWYLLHVSKSKTSKIIFLCALIIQTAAIFLTFSKGSIIGLFFFFWGVFLLSKKISKPYFWILSLLIFFLATVFVFLQINRDKGFVAESRTRIATKLLFGFSKRPLLGWGLANVDYAFAEVPWPFRLEHDVYLDKAHSMLLEVSVTTGIVGFLIYLTIIIYILKRLYQNVFKKEQTNYWYQTLFLVFLLYLFHSQTNVISIAEEVLFWLVIGIMGSKAG